MLLLGYAVLDSPGNRALLRWAGPATRRSLEGAGTEPLTLMWLLCNLPFEFFSSARAKAVLFPTLAAACAGDAENRALLSAEMNQQLLVSFLRDPPAMTGADELFALRLRVPMATCEKLVAELS